MDIPRRRVAATPRDDRLGPDRQPPAQAGVKPSHVNSLAELLAAHGHVCVKFNGLDADGVADAATSLAGVDGVVLLTKSSSVLYGRAER